MDTNISFHEAFKNTFNADILIFPLFPTSNHFKHILERDVASLQVLRVLALTPSLDAPADADWLAGIYHQPSGSHRDDRFGSEYLKQLYTP